MQDPSLFPPQTIRDSLSCSLEQFQSFLELSSVCLLDRLLVKPDSLWGGRPWASRRQTETNKQTQKKEDGGGKPLRDHHPE